MIAASAELNEVLFQENLAGADIFPNGKFELVDCKAGPRYRRVEMLHGLRQLLDSGYIGEFELVDDHRGGKIVVELTGRLNKTGVISPRYNIGVGELEAWTARLLPSRQV